MVNFVPSLKASPLTIDSPNSIYQLGPEMSKFLYRHSPKNIVKND
jgi:hypothetical protein